MQPKPRIDIFSFIRENLPYSWLVLLVGGEDARG
jgi:hypothetical protein